MPERCFTLTPEQLRGYKIENEPPNPDKKDKKKSDQFLPKEVAESLATLRIALDNRFSEFSEPSPGIETPTTPREFGEAHIEAMNDFFGEGNLEATAFPSPNNLGDKYFEVMFSAGKRQRDEDKNLLSYRPDWWGETADSKFTISEDESKKTNMPRATWGDLYVKSMKAEAAEMRGVLLFSETIQKPKYTDGSQQYGTVDGQDADHDHLLPVIKEVFGEQANRFNLSWDQINQELLPRLKEKLAESFKSKGLAVPDFDIIITPALISNLQTTLKHPADSNTDTYNWTSTPFMIQKDEDSGSRLVVGDSDDGGAGCVDSSHRERSWNRRGFRLSVVLKNT